jgi:DNA polymerase III sliding clamp (beta) subunit (PCNA family)
MSDKDKMNKIRWEYNNMFDFLTKLINNNVDEYSKQIEKDKENEF